VSIEPDTSWRTWLREPLLHFMVLGAALFLLAGLLGKKDAPRVSRIVVSAGTIESLSLAWQRTSGRPPTPQELDGLIEDHLREEILYREALALGLERDDTVVRRRLREKFEFLFEDAAQPAEPTDAELEAYIEAHADAYRVEARFSFRHVFLRAERRNTLAADMERLRDRLRAASASSGVALGDPFPMGHDFEALQASDAERIFGTPFASALEALPLDAWVGPVESAQGRHFVRVHERIPERTPTLGDVRNVVQRDWREARRREANEALYRELRARYVVIVEPESGPGGR